MKTKRTYEQEEISRFPFLSPSVINIDNWVKKHHSDTYYFDWMKYEIMKFVEEQEFIENTEGIYESLSLDNDLVFLDEIGILKYAYAYIAYKGKRRL